MPKEINIYVSFESWNREMPDSVIRGSVVEKSDGYIVVADENGYTQIINLNKLYAVVY
jgi:hypothetical protein